MTKIVSKAKAQKVSKKSSQVRASDLNEEIKKRAYLKFENSGRGNGMDLVHWYEAELEVLAGNK